jgi:tRNA (cmo5U34)-methyltransferase
LTQQQKIYDPRNVYAARDETVLSSCVSDHFAHQWGDYDRQIRQAIPGYDFVLELLVDIIRRGSSPPASIVDAGIGTGQLAAGLLTAFPDAQLTGIDIVPSYLELASQRLGRYGQRVTLIEGDLAILDLPDGADLYVTSFALHHMTDATKQRVYRQMHAGLKASGVIINVDFVDSPSKYYSSLFDQMRIRLMRAEGMSAAEIENRYVRHRQLERPTPLTTQMQWLDSVGCCDVECFWKYLNLAMFGGRKRPS